MTAPLPLGATALMGMAIALLSQQVTLKEATNGFTTGTPWIILVAYCLAIPFISSGLGKRLSLHCVGMFGKSSLGLVYALGFTETLCSLAIPSVSARAGGIVLPFAKELSTVAGSSPDDGTEDQFGKFLHLTLFHMAQIGSGFFIISVPSNMVSLNCAENLTRAKVELDFGTWLLGSCVEEEIDEF